MKNFDFRGKGCGNTDQSGRDFQKIDFREKGCGQTDQSERNFQKIDFREGTCAKTDQSELSTTFFNELQTAKFDRR